MTPVIGDIIQQTVGRVVGKLLDHYLPKTMSEEEREAIRLKAVELAAAETDRAAREVTLRHRYDMRSDSWLSKNVRPATLIYLMLAWTGFTVAGTVYTIPPDFVAMLSGMLKAVFGFYFIGRSFEKGAALVLGKKTQG